MNSGRLGPGQRRLVLGALVLVAGSGLAWIGLGTALDPGDFADPLRAWRHRTLVLHGLSAYGLLWLLGTLFPQHQLGAWRAGRNRGSGVLLGSVLLALALSGLTLYYPPDEDWRTASSLLHQALGLSLLLLLSLHVRAGHAD